MGEHTLPRVWEELANRLNFFPVVVKSLEKIHDESWSMEKNIHDHYELVYIKRGNAVFNISGIDVVLHPHSIVIIKPQQWHKFNVKQSSCEFIVLSFGFSDEKSYNADLSPADFIDYVQDLEKGAFITLRLTPKNELVLLLQRIIRERDKPELFNDFMIYLLIIELFVLISRNLKHELEQQSRDRNRNLKDSLVLAKEFIESNYNRDISLSDVAKYIFLSESYFAHTFKEAFGVSPKNYILKVRIGSAEELLSKTDLKISDIAISVGFSSQQRFNDIFKKHTGLTPLRYRKDAKKLRINKD